jgi:hypothetical protein
MDRLYDKVYFVTAGFCRPEGEMTHRIISPHFASKKEATEYLEKIPDLPEDIKIWRYTEEAHA